MSNMQQYHDLLETILSTGSRQANRTGVDAISVPGAMMRFNLQEGFPAITTKKLAFGMVKAELLGFFRGYQSAQEFRDLGCKVWDQNANENQAWLSNSNRKGTDDLGRIYGAQWTDWRDWREVRSYEAKEDLVRQGYSLLGMHANKGGQADSYIVRKGINQLEGALEQIINNPTNRRIIINSWRPDEFDQMALPPCHVMAQFLVNVEKGELHCCMTQRSCDFFLGIPFNIASYALFLEIMARLSGLKAGTFTHFCADSHVYVNHVDNVKEQLSRKHFEAPRLYLGSAIKQVFSKEDIKGVFERINLEDIALVNYQSHDAIKASMAV